MNPIFDIMGVRVYSSPHLPLVSRKQFRFPKSKKKRIRKKWQKMPDNYRDYETHAMMIADPAYPKSNCIFMSEKHYEELSDNRS